MPLDRKKVIAISGSTRKSSTNEAILRYIANTYKHSLDIELYTGLADLPHFNPDLENDKVPKLVQAFCELIQKADGVIICTPEYIFSLPGSLKNAIEWTVATTIFLDKPVGIIVASGLGDKAYESLLLIMKTVGARVGEHSATLIQGARSKFDSQGRPVDDVTRDQLAEVMRSFAETLTN